MKELVMFKTDKEDYQKFIVNYGIVPSLILLQKFENLEFYEECEKILRAIDSINTKVLIYKETKLTDEVIDGVINDYKKMGMEDMDREKLMERSEKYAASFIANNSFMIFKSK